MQRIPRKSWAPHKRGALLRQAALALRQLSRRKTCAALAREERFRIGLADARTWRHGRPPRRSLRRPRKLLAGAGKRLLKAAGARCAVQQKVSRGVRRHRGEPLGQRVTPPPGSPDQGEGEEEERELRELDQGKLRLPKRRPPEARVEPDPHEEEAGGAGLIAHAAADTFTFFRSTDVGIPPRAGGVSEPTAAVAGDVVWYTGNASVALSTNGGRTFTYFDPSTVLPDDGLAFCCDQLVSYDPVHRLFVWISQYWCAPPDARCTNSGNRIRLATASPEGLKRYARSPNLAWTWWDMTPRDFGIKTKTPWFDRSDMSIDDWYVNWTVNVLRGGQKRAVLARYPLQALAKAPRELHWFFQTDRNARFQAAQGRHDGTIFISANSHSQYKAFTWARAADKMFRHDLDHSTIPQWEQGAIGADGANWLARQMIFPGSPDAATVAGDSLYIATTTGRSVCTSKCDSKSPVLKRLYPHPTVHIAQYDVNTFKLLNEDTIWRSDTAYALPALATDRAGDVGIGLRSAPAGGNPGPVAGFLTPVKELTKALTAIGNPLIGDYYSIRPGRTRRSFVMTGESIDNAPALHWNYFEFGYGPSPYVSPPSVSIRSPDELDVFDSTSNEDLYFYAVGSDPVDGILPPSAYRWTYDGKRTTRRGMTLYVDETVPGIHTATVTVRNGDGATARDTVHVRVKAPPEPGHPIVHITFPPDGASYCTNAADGAGDYVTVGMGATATDPSTPPGPLTYAWTDSVAGGARQTVATTLTPSLKLYLRAGDLRTTHDLRLTATNSTGSTSDDVRVEVKDPSLCLN